MEQAMIASALVKAQKSFGPALRNAENGGFKAKKYADLTSCVNAVLTALNDNGIMLMQTPLECSDGALVETIFLHESGEEYRAGKMHVPASKHDAHGYGSALTYARRYGLMTACGIAPEDDDGNAATKNPPIKNDAPVKQLESGSAPKIEWAKASEGKQATIRDFVLELGDHIEAENYAAVFETVESWNLDNDDKTLLWSQLPSTTRSALTRIGASKREAAH